MRKPAFVRSVCLLLLLAYGLLADPRMAWALGLNPSSKAAHSCGVASCRCEHGAGAHAGACCHTAADKLESKYPGVRAYLQRLQAQEDALPANGTRVKAAGCSTRSDEEAPAPGRPHTLACALGAGLSCPIVIEAPSPMRANAIPRGEALLKVPLI